MGDGMARNLIKGGRDVVVWNRTGSKAVEFSKETGCETAQTPKEVGTRCTTRFPQVFHGGCRRGVFFSFCHHGRGPETSLQYAVDCIGPNDMVPTNKDHLSSLLVAVDSRHFPARKTGMTHILARAPYRCQTTHDTELHTHETARSNTHHQYNSHQ